MNIIVEKLRKVGKAVWMRDTSLWVLGSFGLLALLKWGKERKENMSVVFSLFATSCSTKITCIIVYLGNIWRHHRHKLYWWHCYWWCGDHGWCLSLTWWVDSFESDSEIWLVTDQLTYSKTCIDWTLTSEWVLIDSCFAWCPLDTVFIVIWIKSMTL